MIKILINMIYMEFVIIWEVLLEDIIQHFVKNANSKWYLFNDTNWTEVNLGALKSPHAYCFFYRKQKK